MEYWEYNPRVFEVAINGKVVSYYSTEKKHWIRYNDINIDLTPVGKIVPLKYLKIRGIPVCPSN